MLRAIGVISAVISALVIFVVLKEVFRIVRKKDGLDETRKKGKTYEDDS